MRFNKYSARNFQIENLNTPENIAPGMYNPNFKRRKYHANVPFGSSTRREVFPNTSDPEIAPGKYTPLTITPKKSHSFSLDSTREYFQDYSRTPSPAAYSLSPNWVKKEKTIFTDSKGTLPKENVPFKFSNIGEDSPGPAKYSASQIEYPKGFNFSSSKSAQRPPVYYNGIPGPGSYKPEANIRDADKKTYPKIDASANRYSYLNKDINDAYMLDHKAWPLPEETDRPFGGITPREFPICHTDTPSPDAYAAKYKPVSKKKNNKDFGIDRPAPFNLDESLPGPGSYCSPHDEFNLVGGFIGNAPKIDLWEITPDKLSTPGPAHYDVVQYPYPLPLPSSSKPVIKRPTSNK